MNITVKVKSVYGIDKVYPADIDSSLFAKLAGTTTLTPKSIEIIKALGYTITIEKEEL
jgi:hypothetical protein